MYLKSIEVQGFKSFANKIVFDFHNGITGIVGPNGSGKSNVADAVRWVLGEQSAKQLRGAKMEDVIFAGTETRKPVGYAYVSITLDNADHALPVEYDEVTVTRKVFRSGESEYLINGHGCRLKDISELFYDTGIGKEGYSIIGQGQIDKILSGKPEERRELFDEAAGIVKFKRRKAAAVKKLENERNNLVRIGDILAELEKQVGPLKLQSEKAREYLKHKEELKKCDVNAFLLESDKIREDLKALESKIRIADGDLSAANEAYESTKAEYEAAEQQLAAISNEIEMTQTLLSNTELEKQRLEGIVNVYREQIKTVEANHMHYNSRLSDIEQSVAKRQESLLDFDEKKEQLGGSLADYQERQAEAEKHHQEILLQIETVTQEIEKNKDEIFVILDEKSSIKADHERFQTMLEQYHIKKAELNSEVIRGKSEENAQELLIADYDKKLEETQQNIDMLTAAVRKGSETIAAAKEKIGELTSSIDKQQQQYHREKSKLESLVNITERYDGYGISIRKIMEKKEENSGILGVVADIVKVEKRYETAIETALGGTIQNIVTDNENTAKELIGYLKENQYGRATFLPLSSVSGKNTLEREECVKEPGVVGIASNLVRVSFEYGKLMQYLLGRILVVDNIDNAMRIAKKYKYTLRIVTLEGEQLNPGGSMTGGAFKNASNLLGRRREIEELKKTVSDISRQIHAAKEETALCRKELAKERETLENNNKLMREAQLAYNTAEMKRSLAQAKKNEITESYREAMEKLQEIEKEIAEIHTHIDTASKTMANLEHKNEDSQKEISQLADMLEQKKQEEADRLSQTEHLKIEFSALLQKVSFIEENQDRLKTEISAYEQERTEILEKLSQTEGSIEEKNAGIEAVNSQIEAAKQQIAACMDKAKQLKQERDNKNNSHKAFFDKREAINAQISALDKECYRLNTQKEKLEETNDGLADYMWNEYEITYGYALDLRDPAMDNLAALKKQIAALKSALKELGDVNVNAIDEYQEVSERHTFLKAQHDDLIQAEEALIKVIDELDSGMRIQFTQKFREIKTEFDKVFRELFGGGRGTIELVEGEDILEAGILIISQPPGKKLQNMMQLSGGEKALTAISLLFAIQNLKPSPFCLLDEIEAALDDSNVGRYAKYLHKLTRHTQFIVITHRRGTMTAADRLYGITMQEKGVSALVSVDLIVDDLEREERSNMRNKEMQEAAAKEVV